MNKRKFIKTFLYGVLCLIFPFRISAVEKKIINPNLTEEQKNIMFNEGTERAGSSILNYEKREGSYPAKYGVFSQIAGFSKPFLSSLIDKT